MTTSFPTRNDPDGASRPPGRPDPAGRLALQVIACDGCGRRFTTSDGPGMMASIKGPCPDCGGRFRLVDRD
jgi:hypothetical protein